MGAAARAGPCPAELRRWALAAARRALPRFPDLHDEVANDAVMLALLAHEQRGEQIESLTRFTCGVARRVALRALNTLKRHNRAAPIGNGTDVASACAGARTTAALLDPEHLAIARQELALVRTRACTLDDRSREVLELSISGLTARQIGSRLGLKADCVRQILARARKRLR